MNLPNLLTSIRLVFIPVYVVFFGQGHYGAAFTIVALSILTDVADGYIARKRNQVTYVGSMLDPLADKCMMITVILTLFLEKLIPWEAVAAILIRDVGMILGSLVFHFRGKKMPSANMLGKLTTVFYYAAILLLILQLDIAVWILWFAIAFSFFTSFVYIGQLRHVNQKA
ncbi:CDP-alcohol phosphatidyltransferase family protein [Marinicrinis lubricantis]|uniref:CDP-diacylglycerol--glycerol-3-phosphate 3-phosphatidyltransferase n=1 Tax=Marinicrinis lubricantis TaxID=2086470 RepID=A0ABW1IKC4_9BACL